MNSAKVVALTQPVLDIDTTRMSVEQFVAYVARVSNPSNQNNMLTAAKLLKYLVKHKHWSPFEMVHVVMEIETTRDIARQILRHRSFSFQEFSQRYADPTKDLGFVTREARKQDSKNRQNSVDIPDDYMVEDGIGVDPNTFKPVYGPVNLKKRWADHLAFVENQAKSAYAFAMKHGIAKEQARVVLPEGLTVSRMYMSGSLRSWIHYCELRMANGTQKEHQDVAKSAWGELTKYFPSLIEVVTGD